MTLIKVRNLKKYYDIKDQKGSHLYTLKALNDVSFDLEKDRIIGIVGESGCGKSTLGKTMLALQPPTSGKMEINGVDIYELSKKELRIARKNMQIIFQDPYSSLNRRKRILDTLELPLKIHYPDLSKKERIKMIDDILIEVGLDPKVKLRYPHQFSGGQQQRLAIARALIINPEFIVADESVSALDVSVQAQILNLINSLKKKHKFTCMFISHDLKVVEFISDYIIVMYMGKIVEMGSKEDLEKEKLHPYTQLLFDSYPSLDLKQRDRKRIELGEPPNYKNPPKGCAFYSRCSKRKEKCKNNLPTLEEIRKKHFSACWLNVE